MTAEQDRALAALRTAIKMEIDGKEFYLKASRESGNDMGRKLFSTLAGEEDVHRQKFEEIYQALAGKKGWPAVKYQSDKGQHRKTVFARAMKDTAGLKVQTIELDAVKTAVDMENKTYDYYLRQSQTATFDGEREFYEAVMAQERQHAASLLSYFEFLKDPGAWFVAKEHPSLD
jgi:rubrerythrin